MGILIQCNHKKIQVSYSIWNQVKIYLGSASITYINHIIEQNKLNKLFYDNYMIDKTFVKSLNHLLKNLNNNHMILLHNIILFYKQFIQTITLLQLQGIDLFINQLSEPYTFNHDESINFINTIDTVKSTLDSYNDTNNDNDNNDDNNSTMNYYVNHIYNLHKYGTETFIPVLIN